MKRASDGEETGSVKIFLEEEVQIDKAIKDGIFIKMFYHPAKRYIASRFVQCHKCQGLDGHQTSNCKNKRKCMKCAEEHHHSDCLKTPDQYLCSNCGSSHSANDSRCPKIKEAKEAASAHSATARQIRPQTAAAAAPAVSSHTSFPAISGSQTAKHQIGRLQRRRRRRRRHKEDWRVWTKTN